MERSQCHPPCPTPTRKPADFTQAPALQWLVIVWQDVGRRNTSGSPHHPRMGAWYPATPPSTTPGKTGSLDRQPATVTNPGDHTPWRPGNYSGTAKPCSSCGAYGSRFLMSPTSGQSPRPKTGEAHKIGQPTDGQTPTVGLFLSLHPDRAKFKPTNTYIYRI